MILILIPTKLRKLSQKTKAIISVDIAGYPVDYDKIKELISSTEITTLFNGESDNQKKMVE